MNRDVPTEKPCGKADTDARYVRYSCWLANPSGAADEVAMCCALDEWWWVRANDNNADDRNAVAGNASDARKSKTIMVAAPWRAWILWVLPACPPAPARPARIAGGREMAKMPFLAAMTSCMNEEGPYRRLCKSACKDFGRAERRLASVHLGPA
jgi:hypothetical protein